MGRIQQFENRLNLKWAGWRAGWRLFNTSRKVAGHARPQAGQAPVVFFNASTRLTGFSQNAAFAFLAACGLQLAGVPVVYFACKSGMSRCVLGTDRDDYSRLPPCRGCIAQAQRVFGHAPVVWFEYREDQNLANALQDLDVDALARFEYRPDSSRFSAPIPLGALVLPALRWALRRHHLPDDAGTRFLFREYLLSAYRVAVEFEALLEQVQPAAAVIFNGIMYPEATADWVAKQRGLRVITHEVGFQPFSAFFTDGQATAYPIDIRQDFELSPEQDARLDAYLEQRFQGKFSMAGIRFWPEMRDLDQAFLEKAASFRQVVPVFTNVIYDTSQVHANSLFPHMFAWLNLILDVIHANPETLFVIRAHPDEMRPGTRKQSRESVQEWAARNRLESLPNAVFVNSQEYLSSYELIQRSKFVMVYNSSIGLEAALLGAPVLCGGKARFTQLPMVFFPDSAEAYRREAQAFLDIQSRLVVPSEFKRNARRFLYYQLYKASLPFEDYLENYPRPGFVQLKPFRWQSLRPENSRTVRTLVDGICGGKPFLLDDG